MVIDFLLDMYALKPTKAYEYDAGFDLYVPTDISEVTVEPHSSVTIDVGVHIMIPQGYVGMIKSKSGLNVKHGINCEGVVDAFYNGSIVVKAYNHSNKPYVFKGGDKITQLVILPIPDVTLRETFEPLPETDRGSNGFGSSGK